MITLERGAGCRISDAKPELCRNRGILGNQYSELRAQASPASSEPDADFEHRHRDDGGQQKTRLRVSVRVAPAPRGRP